LMLDPARRRPRRAIKLIRLPPVTLSHPLPTGKTPDFETFKRIK
jgi:hypothetical protein